MSKPPEQKAFLQGIAGVFTEEGDCSILYPDAVYDLSAPPG